VLTIASAFMWLLSVLVPSLVWLAIPPLQVRRGELPCGCLGAALWVCMLRCTLFTGLEPRHMCRSSSARHGC
jgi:hypothetical protein